MCQPPAAPAASSSPCSTLSCRTFSDLVSCHQAAPQAAGGGTAAPLSCGPRQQQHLQPKPWEEAHKVFNIHVQSHAGKNQKVKKPSHLSYVNSLDDLDRPIRSTSTSTCAAVDVVDSRRAVIPRLSFFRPLNPTWTKLSGSI